jgi:diguanylate cyclase (GGDEF)-like protein
MLRAEDISTATTDAIRTLLTSLQARIPLKLWIVTAIDGEDWQFVFRHDMGCSLNDAQISAWQEAFCRRMISQSTSAAESFVEEGAAAPADAGPPTVRAYIGVPLHDDNHQLIGTLCGIDPEPDVAGIRSGEALVRQTATLLSRLLSMESHVAAQRFLAKKWSDSASRDELTGLLNRHGWDELMRQTRSILGKEIHGVIVVDIAEREPTADANGFGALLHRAASALTVSMRGQDAVARLGDHSFGILLRCDSPAMVNAVVMRIEQELRTAAVEASTGFATSPPALSLDAAFVAAYAMMSQRRQARDE